MTSFWPGIQENISLASHTSWLVGGPAQYFVEPKTVSELVAIHAMCCAKKLPMTYLGGGTNILVSDSGIQGAVVSLARLSGINVVDESREIRFWALAGTPKSDLLKVFLKYKSPAACFLAGLPGQVGGGVVMNAGVSENLRPREFGEITEAVEVLRPDGALEVVEAESLTWSYRHCTGWQPGMITQVRVCWPNEPEPDVLDIVKKLNQNRLQKQPLEKPSCGSVFRNPLPKHAGQLIEAAGLKGHSIGGAQISPKHANFIVNNGSATAADIRKLIELCQSTVKEKFGVDLQTEVVFLG